MSRFFCSCDRSEVLAPHSLTMVLCHDEGSDSVVTKCLDTMIDPLAALSFSDFSIAECIKHGISYKALNITPDMKLGHDKEFESLEQRFADTSSNLFNPSKTE